MLLEQIDIKNFKGLKAATFKATKFSCLVGENNAGKSTVLQAIVAALKQVGLSSSQLYDAELCGEFKLAFSGITEADLERLGATHRAKIEPLVEQGRFTLISRCKAGEKAEYRILKKVPREARYREEAVAGVFKGKKGSNAIREALEESYPEFIGNAPEDLSTIAKATEYVAKCLSGLGEQELEIVDGPLPSGMAPSITALIPEPIYIPAVKNLADDLKTTQSTSFGRLLGLLLEDMEPDLAQISESLLKLDTLFNRIVRDGVRLDERHEKVRSLESLLEGILCKNFPSAKIELAIPPPQLRTILNAAEIYIDDGSRDLIENKGDGIKRSLTFALLQAYVQRQREKIEDGAAHRPLMFLFEEPELYLHPRSQKVLFDTLAAISSAHQVIVTTHSPLFFAPGVTAGFTRVAKETSAPKPVGVLYPIDFTLDQTSAEVFRLARFENADAAFFSSRVVLFEGQSDDSYLKHVARKLNLDWDFERKSVGLVRVDGKGNFGKYRAFFESFGMKVMIVADLDALFKDYEHLGASEAANLLRDAAIQRIDARIQEADLAATPSASQIGDRFRRHTFRQTYANAKVGLKNMKTTRIVDDEALALIDSLFSWESELSRCLACRQDPACASAIVPLLDQLRTQGICVLSKGPIEEYYPDNCPADGSKPSRALKAASMVETEAQALALSEPLAANRPPELKEILAELFSGL
ncbi:AAA family ATPase [Bradyrhizobium glycinis]|uniref:AAA family ATPase n=1 Tax=Bradyrhizobium glycinis TaxID=2751812 RepID=UPI0018D710BA|nr:AAA family ATPase [Bradyrhizobium glycinis]MBH5373369.1 ATP-dependent endonuclease [Bradyrhizobium glycinis]